MSDLSRRSALQACATAGACLLLGGVARAEQKSAPPRLGRYKVENAAGWNRDLVIETDKDYAVYEARNGPLYGRGTYSYDGQYVRFLTGPYHTMGYWGSSFVQDDGRHRIRLGTAEATSLD